VDSYRAGYAAIKYAFLPRVFSTSGRLHGEFLRLLYIIAHSRTSKWFRQHSNDEPSGDAFKFRRGQSKPGSALALRWFAQLGDDNPWDESF